MGSLVRVITVVDGVVTRMAFGGGTSDGSDYLFAVGPDVALRWLGILGPAYLEDDWSRSRAPYDGYLIDADRKLLLFYVGLGQFSVGSRYALRAAMLDAYPRTWAGWTVSWAYHGWDDITSALGWPSLPRANPRAACLHPYRRDDADPIAYVVTAGDRAYGFDYNASQPWRLGTGLLDELPSSRVFTAEEASPAPPRRSTPTPPDCADRRTPHGCGRKGPCSRTPGRPRPGSHRVTAHHPPTAHARRHDRIAAMANPVGVRRRPPTLSRSCSPRSGQTAHRSLGLGRRSGR